jgi:hypothetical protein
VLILAKIIGSACLIAGINALARANPSLAGWISALPVVSFLSVIWLAVDRQDAPQIYEFVRGVLYGLPLTAVLLGVIALSLWRGFPVVASMTAGAVIWAGCTWAATQLGLLS